MTYPDEADLFEEETYREYDRRDSLGRIAPVTLDTIEGNPDDDYPYDAGTSYDNHWSY